MTDSDKTDSEQTDSSIANHKEVSQQTDISSTQTATRQTTTRRTQEVPQSVLRLFAMLLSTTWSNWVHECSHQHNEEAMSVTYLMKASRFLGSWKVRGKQSSLGLTSERYHLYVNQPEPGS